MCGNRSDNETVSPCRLLSVIVSAIGRLVPVSATTYAGLRKKDALSPPTNRTISSFRSIVAGARWARGRTVVACSVDGGAVKEAVPRDPRGASPTLGLHGRRERGSGEGDSDDAE